MTSTATQPSSTSVVLDASALVALLTSGGVDGEWVAARCRGRRLLGPALLPFETTNVVRRLVQRGVLDETSAHLALADLADLALRQWPHQSLAERIWALRDNLSSYDAAYVALAELTDAPLITLDRRLAAAPGPHCEILVPSTP